MDKLPISILAERAQLPGELALPAQPRGLIILARSGGEVSDAVGARSAEALQAQNFATLRLDLLAPHEAQFEDNHHSIHLLFRRLLATVELMKRQDTTFHLPIGIFAQRDAGAAAVRVAALRDRDVLALAAADALVDLAGAQNLRLLRAPLLLLLPDSANILIAAAGRTFSTLPASTACALQTLPTEGEDAAPTLAALPAAELVTAWFGRHMPPPTVIEAAPLIETGPADEAE